MRGDSVGARPAGTGSRHEACVLAMRLKSAIWVAAYIRRCQVEGIFAAVRRQHGADEAGRDLHQGQPARRQRRSLRARAAVGLRRGAADRSRLQSGAQDAARAGGRRRGVSRARDPLRSGRMDRRDRGAQRAASSRSCALARDIRPNKRTWTSPVRRSRKSAICSASRRHNCWVSSAEAHCAACRLLHAALLAVAVTMRVPHAIGCAARCARKDTPTIHLRHRVHA